MSELGVELQLDVGLEPDAGAVELKRPIRAAMTRQSSSNVKVTPRGDSIQVGNASDDDQRRLIGAFVAPHASSSP